MESGEGFFLTELEVLFQLSILSTVLWRLCLTKLFHEKVVLVPFDRPVDELFANRLDLFWVLLVLSPLLKHLLNETGQEDEGSICGSQWLECLEHNLSSELLDCLIDDIRAFALESWSSARAVSGLEWQEWDATYDLG